MGRKKGTLRRIADAVGGAVQTAAAGVGLTTRPGPEAAGDVPMPQPKSARKAGQKASVARAEQTQQDVKDARRASARRTGP